MSATIGRAQAAGFLIVALTLIEAFTIPRTYFYLGSIAATLCMVCVAVLLPRFRQLYRPSPNSISVGFTSAVVLYLIFYIGNVAIRFANIQGFGAPNEGTIYSLIASGPLYSRLVVLFLDALGFESYFRGTLQNYFQMRLGWRAPFLAALMDAMIHVSTFNPLFVTVTFVADSAWGLTYYLTKDLSSSFVSHLVWDISVFILFPIS